MSPRVMSTPAAPDAINGAQLFAVTGDTRVGYLISNGSGVRYARTNEQGLSADDAHALVAGASAFGYAATASATDALALGRNSTASFADSVALGANA